MLVWFSQSLCIHELRYNCFPNDPMFFFSTESLPCSVQGAESNHPHSSVSGLLHYLPCTVRCSTLQQKTLKFSHDAKKKLRHGEKRWSEPPTSSKWHIWDASGFPPGNPQHCFEAPAPVAVVLGTCGISHRWSLIKQFSHYHTRTEAEAERSPASEAARSCLVKGTTLLPWAPAPCSTHLPAPPRGLWDAGDLLLLLAIPSQGSTHPLL